VFLDRHVYRPVAAYMRSSYDSHIPDRNVLTMRMQRIISRISAGNESNSGEAFWRFDGVASSREASEGSIESYKVFR
jgi:hypothetical protein